MPAANRRRSRSTRISTRQPLDDADEDYRDGHDQRGFSSKKKATRFSARRPKVTSGVRPPGACRRRSAAWLEPLGGVRSNARAMATGPSKSVLRGWCCAESTKRRRRPHVAGSEPSRGRGYLRPRFEELPSRGRRAAPSLRPEPAARWRSVLERKALRPGPPRLSGLHAGSAQHGHARDRSRCIDCTWKVSLSRPSTKGNTRGSPPAAFLVRPDRRGVIGSVP